MISTGAGDGKSSPTRWHSLPNKKGGEGYSGTPGSLSFAWRGPGAAKKEKKLTATSTSRDGRAAGEGRKRRGSPFSLARVHRDEGRENRFPPAASHMDNEKQKRWDRFTILYFHQPPRYAREKSFKVPDDAGWRRERKKRNRTASKVAFSHFSPGRLEKRSARTQLHRHSFGPINGGEHRRPAFGFSFRFSSRTENRPRSAAQRSAQRKGEEPCGGVRFSCRVP